MARLINSKYTQTITCNIRTLFEDGTETKRTIKKGDVVTGLRYVDYSKGAGEVVTVSGKVLAINYKSANPLNYKAKAPANCFDKDCQLKSLQIDASEQYSSKIVTVPLNEVVEDEGVTGVKRMKYDAAITVDIEMVYSDGSVVYQSLEPGDTLNDVKIIVPEEMKEINGNFTVDGFGYKMGSNSELTITGVILSNADTPAFVTPIKNILGATEVFSYPVTSADEAVEAISYMKTGDTLKLSDTIDARATALSFNGIDCEFDLNGQVVEAGGGPDSAVRVANGTLVLSGAGVIESALDYDRSHGSGVVQVTAGGKLVFDGANINAVREDPVNKGQFGIVVTSDGSVEFNDGEVKAGWYAISGNGTTTTADAVFEVNGGRLVSTSDFAIYLPHAGRVIINDGLVAGAAGGISANNGSIEIHGGTITSKGNGDTGEWSDGTSGQANAAINLNGRYGPVSLFIDGGYITAENGAAIVVAGTANPVTINISGGFFSAPVQPEWCASGYVPTEEPDENGYYTVVKEEVVEG